MSLSNFFRGSRNQSNGRPVERNLSCQVIQLIGTFVYDLEDLSEDVRRNTGRYRSLLTLTYTEKTTLRDLNRQIGSKEYLTNLRDMGSVLGYDYPTVIYNYIEINQTSYSLDSPILVKDVVKYLGNIYQIGDTLYQVLRGENFIGEIFMLESLDQIRDFLVADSTNLSEWTLINSDQQTDSNYPIPHSQPIPIPSTQIVDTFTPIQVPSSMVAVSLMPDLSRTYSKSPGNIFGRNILLTSSDSISNRLDVNTSQNTPIELITIIFTGGENIVPATMFQKERKTFGTSFNYYRTKLQMSIPLNANLAGLCKQLNQLYPIERIYSEKFSMKTDRRNSYGHISESMDQLKFINSGIRYFIRTDDQTYYLIDNSKALVSNYLHLLPQIYRMSLFSAGNEHNYYQARQIKEFDEYLYS